MKLLIVIVYLILNGIGLILIKLGSDTLSIGIRRGIFNCSMSWFSILGLLCYIGSFLIFNFLLVKKFDLIYLMPIITGISQIFVILAGLFIFKEHISRYGIIGIIAVTIGVVLMNIK